MSDLYMASNESDSYAPPQLFAGSDDIQTNAFTVAAGVTLVANSVVAFNTSNELVEWVPGAADITANAIGITCEAIDTSAGAAKHPVYIDGYFNTDAIQWPAGTTADQKLLAFARTDIHHRSLGYSG